MDRTLGLIKEISDRYNLEPGDWFKVTINAVGNPSIEYHRKITPERVEEGVFNEQLDDTEG